ncbi:unnamed protein product [Cochlearia groenlandica]
MMGPQWTRVELKRFYNAYRKHGRDWKKVASEVWNNRSVDMVEALFTINKAYLSLPEEIASLAGFIAMMTDHHSVVEESKSEGEGHGASAAPEIHQKRKRAKILPSDRKKEGCLAILKQTKAYGRRRRATKKRTPRVNVADYANVSVEVSRGLVPTADLIETEPSALLKGERIANNVDKKSNTPKEVSISHRREIPKQAEPDDNGLIDGISVVEERQVGQCPANQLKTAKTSEESSSTGDKTITVQDAVVSATQVSGLGPASLPQKPPNRRKMSLKKSLQERAKSSHDTPPSYQKKSEHELLKERVSTCLSCPLVRRRCMFEWFHSAIDYPWFVKKEFNDYLSHVGLGHVPNLTRLEWSIIKSSIGRPRRFSERFLKEERDKLEQYRESVRQIHTKIRTGSTVETHIPIDLPRPLSVGDTVIAIHPKTKEICDGNILTVDHNKCKVLFDDLGSYLVMDIDCMPLNQSKYLTEGQRRLADNGKEVVRNRNPSSDANAIFRPPVLENVNFPMNPPVKQRTEREMLGIVSGSIAHKMVDVAMKAASSVKDEEDAVKMVQQALENFLVPCIKQQDHSSGIFDRHQQNRSNSNTAEPATNSRSSETEMATELITSCVATCLMIKGCMEKQYPSEVVAKLMETAMSELQPRGPQNMPIYREIQTYLGLIRNEIMDRVRRR